MLTEIAELNPKRQLVKGMVARCIDMAQLSTSGTFPNGWEMKPYNGGMRFSNGDTIIARITPCLENGKHAYVTILNDDEIAYGSTEYIVIRGKKGISDNTFVYYLTHFPPFKNAAIKSMVGTSGRQRAQVDVLENLIMSLPPLSTQLKIADILSKLDDKIENNRKINENLEQQAQALFKSWFVDFEPFRDQPFVESELGMIPEGWRVGTLSDSGEVVGGSTPSKSKPEFYTSNGIAWLTPKDLSVYCTKFISHGEIDITQAGYNSTSTKLMPKGSVLFSSRAPIGYISIAKNEICTNQGFKSVIPTYAGTAFIYYYLKMMTPEIENRSTGSTFKEASGSLMKSLETIIPPKAIMEEFEDMLRSVFAEQELLEDESHRLSHLRDTLLPKLMSGEIKL